VNDKVCVRRSSIHGRGVFAVRTIRRGSRIGRFEGVPTKRDGAYVLWVMDDAGAFYGIRGTSALRFLNHSLEPNAEFRDDELFALRSIRPDEEITCHYGEAWDSDESWDSGEAWDAEHDVAEAADLAEAADRAAPAPAASARAVPAAPARAASAAPEDWMDLEVEFQDTEELALKRRTA